MAALLVGLVIVVHMGMPGPIPSGADGGNWLAIARERLGEDLMSADVVYPPLFPVLLALGIPLFGAVPSLVVAALLAKCLLVLAVYICSRPVGRWFALGAAVCSGVAGAQLEAFAWGGYPQLTGTALALLTVFFGVRWLGEGNRWGVVLTFVLGVLTFASHTLIAGLLVVALPVAVLHWLLVTRAGRKDWLRATILVLAGVLPGGLFVLLTTVAGSESGVTAVLNPYEIGLFESVRLAIRDAVLPWSLVGVLGVIGFAVRDVTGLRAATLTVGSSWTLVGLAFFIVTGEARALLLTQLGLIILACLAVQRILQRVARRDGDRMRGRRLAYPVMMTLVISMMSAIIVGGLVAYSAAITWYRVASQDVLEALNWLNENSDPDDLIVASAGPNGNPLGWWVQGYGERRTYTGIDERALSFPDERAQAEIANEIFDESANEADTRSLLATNGIDFMVVDRRGLDAGWLSTDVAAGFEMLYESSSVVILEAGDT